MASNYSKNSCLVVTQKKLMYELTIHEVASIISAAYETNYIKYPEEISAHIQFKLEYEAQYLRLLTAVQRGEIAFSDRGDIPTGPVQEQDVWLHADHVLDWLLDNSNSFPIKVPRKLVNLSSKRNLFDLSIGEKELTLDLNGLLQNDEVQLKALLDYQNQSTAELVLYMGEQSHISDQHTEKEQERLYQAAQAQTVELMGQIGTLASQIVSLKAEYNKLVRKKVHKLGDERFTTLLCVMYLILFECTSRFSAARYASHKELYDDILNSFEDFQELFSKRSFDEIMALLKKWVHSYLRS